MIHNDPHKSPKSSKFKQLSKQWNNLIKQFKTQSSLKARVDLPPIIFQRKSPLQNYKNAIKLHQSIKRKKTLTQKIIQLSLQNKRKKISTININQQEIKRHKRFNSSEQIYTLSEEERELLSSKQFHYHRSNTLREENSVDKVNTRDIIKQIKAYHQQQIVKDRMKQSLKDNMHIHNNNNKNNNNNKRQKSKTTIIKHIEIQPTQNNNHPDKSLENNYKKQLQQSMKNYINDQEDQQIASLKSRQQDHQTVQVKTRGLSLQISKDCKSLRYRHQRKEQQNSLQKQKGEDSIAKMLIKNRKQKVQHIFSIFSPNKNNTNNNNLNNTNNNNLNNSNNNNLNNTNNNKSNNQSQSQRILKPWGQQQQLSNIQYREHYSQISITQNNKSSIIKSNTNSPTSRTGKVTLFSPINRKRQKHYMKKYTQSNNRQLKVNINALNSKHYQPWNISINDGVSECLDDGGESSVGFNIENYYKANDDMQIDECQSPNSKTVIIM